MVAGPHLSHVKATGAEERQGRAWRNLPDSSEVPTQTWNTSESEELSVSVKSDRNLHNKGFQSLVRLVETE